MIGEGSVEGHRGSGRVIHLHLCLVAVLRLDFNS